MAVVNHIVELRNTNRDKYNDANDLLILSHTRLRSSFELKRFTKCVTCPLLTSIISDEMCGMSIVNVDN